MCMSYLIEHFHPIEIVKNKPLGNVIHFDSRIEVGSMCGYLKIESDIFDQQPAVSSFRRILIYFVWLCDILSTFHFPLCALLYSQSHFYIQSENRGSVV